MASIILPSGVRAAPSPGARFGSYVSHQVNVDTNEQNIAGDKGNEPTIAVNPLNPANIVVGWRLFDFVCYQIRWLRL
ncbi:hypothetical protein IVG45_09315 [Methylomonas sp. LL1]|uniref:hypothetical protein n=1 Tax=Methylomonas sp. LL1 TaxID=2785785 RepID=UPI0018C3F971|nr:hypothetical protein [Methylomonas sp. LL1]QPK65107.1 hypothetical protein IVG45_09315 [Methylomonas sp. LL1]